MPALKICGVTVPLAVRATRKRPIEVADWDRAFDGTPRGVIRTSKRSFEGSLVYKSQSDAYAFEQLIKGEGHALSFDSDLYTSKGLAPSASTLATVSTTQKRHGAKGLYLQGTAGTATVTWPTAYLTDWTIILWHYDWDGASFEHWIFRSSSITGLTRYKNGLPETVFNPTPWCPTYSSGTGNLSFASPGNGSVAWAALTAKALNAVVKPLAADPPPGYRFKVTTAGTTGAAEPTWPTTLGDTVVDGTVTWTNIGAADQYIDDAVILPFAVPTSWPVAMFPEHDLAAWPSLPRVRADGDLIRGGAINVLGRVGETETIRYPGGGVYESPSFTLLEC